MDLLLLEADRLNAVSKITLPQAKVPRSGLIFNDQTGTLPHKSREMVVNHANYSIC